MSAEVGLESGLGIYLSICNTCVYNASMLLWGSRGGAPTGRRDYAARIYRRGSVTDVPLNTHGVVVWETAA
jgi:hypothetical protein